MGTICNMIHTLSWICREQTVPISASSQCQHQHCSAHHPLSVSSEGWTLDTVIHYPGSDLFSRGNIGCSHWIFLYGQLVHCKHNPLSHCPTTACSPPTALPMPAGESKESRRRSGHQQQRFQTLLQPITTQHWPSQTRLDDAIMLSATQQCTFNTHSK